MLKTDKFAALVIFGVLAASSVFAEGKSAALVNGVPVSQARVELNVKTAVAQGYADNLEMRKIILGNLINLEVMAQEAVKLGLDKNAEVAQQLEMAKQQGESAKQQVLVGALWQDYARKNPISEDQIKQEYDKQKAILGNNEYNVRHILVGTEAEAKNIIAQLDKKANFEKLAVKSKDTGSAAQGGSLGWAAPSKFVPVFANAMLNLKNGEYTKGPVQSPFGWHVIKLDGIRDLKVPPFEEVKPQLQQRLQQQAIQKAITDLRVKAKIEYLY